MLKNEQRVEMRALYCPGGRIAMAHSAMGETHRDLLNLCLDDLDAIEAIIGGDPSVPLVERVRLIAKSVSLSKQENA